MKTNPWTDLKRTKGSSPDRDAANEAWVRAELAAIELRERAGETDADAAADEMGRSERARFETHDDRRGSTHRR